MELDFWTQKASFPGTSRSSAAAFSVENKGYFGTGYNGKDYFNDFGNIIRIQIHGILKQIIREVLVMMP